MFKVYVVRKDADGRVMRDSPRMYWAWYRTHAAATRAAVSLFSPSRTAYVTR